jgi:hypothetical protein
MPIGLGAAWHLTPGLHHDKSLVVEKTNHFVDARLKEGKKLLAEVDDLLALSLVIRDCTCPHCTGGTPERGKEQPQNQLASAMDA